MDFTQQHKSDWKEIKKIYLEAFPKPERKPLFTIKHSVNKGKTKLITSTENGILQGFAMVIPFQNAVMVDYLAVSNNIRGKGTGSKLIEKVCKQFADKKIVLLIEKINNNAPNNKQRLARKKFYIKNGFISSDIFIDGTSGKMEILTYGGNISVQEYLNLQKYAMGNLMFKLSRTKTIK
ncbi:MAG: GNAT family N-acetyltransferase [Clostridia bacterium]|jgi:L-amino acid N-acyltransferase YncA|nr:GNAT family N-acetyltransferase [Clostridia bacterium]